MIIANVKLNTESLVAVKRGFFYKIKRKDGVTLIALIITVVIMLILARSSDISINSK